MNFGTLDNFAVRLHEHMLCSSDGRARPDQDFNLLALELFGLQYDRNAVYRRVCEAREASPARVAHWTEIPAVPTAAFKEWEVSCLPAGERTTVFFSSGTTEQRPSRHFHNEQSLQVYESSLLSWFGAHLSASPSRAEGTGLPSADFRAQVTAPGRRPPCPVESLDSFDQASPFVFRTLALTPPATEAPHSSLVHMFDTLRRSFLPRFFAFTGTAADGAWRLDFPATLDFLSEAINANHPVLMLGTAFSYVHLLDSLAEQKRTLPLPVGSRLLETGGYKGRSRSLPKSDLHALMTHRLAVPPSHIVCEYGMSELSSQAYDRVAGLEDRVNLSIVAHGEVPQGGRSFKFPPWARAQLLSPETGREVGEGETGLLRILDLANVYSVMAIQTEDLAVRRGDGFELIGRAELAEPRGCSLMAR